MDYSVTVKGIVLPVSVSLKKMKQVRLKVFPSGEIKLSAPAGSTLVITFIGYKDYEVKAQSKVKVTLQEDSELLDDVIVTGVARGVSREKLSFSVEKVAKAALKEVTGTTVASTLNGKMPGVKILPLSGDPNSEPLIQLRGAISFASTDQPLIIVDGIVTGGSLKDINMEDVYKMFFGNN